jgi:glycosyltransferase involved in cell wall biosynthesis
VFDKKIVISFLIPAKNAHSTLDQTVEVVHQFLSQNFSDSFEIILVPNGRENCIELTKTIDTANALKEKFSEVVVVQNWISRLKR